MAKRILNDLKSRACVAAGIESFYSPSSWLRRVTIVDTTKNDGYAFQGEFVNDAHEIDLGTPQVLLLCAYIPGRDRTNEYRVLILNPDESLTLTPIQTSGNRRTGWALTIRDEIAALLHTIQTGEVPAVEPWTVTIHYDAEEALTRIIDLTGATDGDIVAAALLFLGAMTETRINDVVGVYTDTYQDL